MWAYSQNRSDLKVKFSKSKGTKNKRKRIYKFSSERITFGPESCRVEATVKEKALRFEMMETQIMETEAKADVQIVSLLILKINKIMH